MITPQTGFRISERAIAVTSCSALPAEAAEICRRELLYCRFVGPGRHAACCSVFACIAFGRFRGKVAGRPELHTLASFEEA